MAENNSQLLSTETIKAEASASVERGGDIREQVRNLTLRALKSRQLNASEIKAVVGAVTDGINLGAAKRAGEVRSALAEGLSGLDDALNKAAEATRLALQQLTSQSKDFREHELTHALESLKMLEEEFLNTVAQAAESAGGRIGQEWKDLVAHARRTGTDTGAQVAATVSELGNKLTTAVSGARAAGRETAREVSVRLASLASGILSGMADALHEKAEALKKKGE
jgi:ABC-type transporter Mla subunit MlaD